MNKDSPPSPAEQAARGICDEAQRIFKFHDGALDIDQRDIEAIIQQAIARSVAETEEKYRKLAGKWRDSADKSAAEQGPSYVTPISRAIAMQRFCASELESLIPKQEGKK